MTTDSRHVAHASFQKIKLCSKLLSAEAQRSLLAYSPNTSEHPPAFFLRFTQALQTVA
ncbi:hypothetical protein SAMN02745166_05185 [Prosthecobacter debontii]|uniref:Uncharacterized protein n=1 Tax=Prosthecobacter debontii TaxID=48467 RepID=A0A1T4Z6X4_9BACT|nr:hypothetical protein SAMN02745166_05185 [Prosthecobacter debontii]